jgi:hypothetical protein
MQLREIEAMLRVRLAGTLPGPEAQARFAPGPAKRGWRTGEFPEDARMAAALLCLYPHEEGVAIPLTVRATTLAPPRRTGEPARWGEGMPAKHWSSGVAGSLGRDRSGAGSVRVLGELTPIHVLVSGFTLHPIVGVTDTRPDFQPAAGEVAEIVEVRLEDLRDASRVRTGTRDREGLRSSTPTSISAATTVWGATAMILGEFIHLLQ